MFHGPVRQIRSSAFLDRRFLVLRTAVLEVEDGELAVDIYVDYVGFQADAVPAVGDVISGTLWLQGCLADAGTGRELVSVPEKTP